MLPMLPTLCLDSRLSQQKLLFGEHFTLSKLKVSLMDNDQLLPKVGERKKLLKNKLF
jgi:hypothetical protein